MNLIYIQRIKPWMKLLIALLYTLTVVNTQHCEGISKSVEQDILTNESYMVYTFLHANMLIRQKEYCLDLFTHVLLYQSLGFIYYLLRIICSGVFAQEYLLRSTRSDVMTPYISSFLWGCRNVHYKTVICKCSL